MSEHEHNVEKAALRQFDTAAKLFFEENYHSAITLAGAAEEILGELVEAEGGKSAHASDISDTIPVYEALTGNKIRTDAESKKFFKDINKYANYPRNSLKHWSDGQDKTLVFDAKKEARAMLVRATENYFSLLSIRHNVEEWDLAGYPYIERFSGTITKDEPQFP